MDELAVEIGAILGSRWVSLGGAARERDPGVDPGNAGGVLCVYPGDTAEVAAVVRACGRRGVGIVPQGGLTGLVGGARQSEAEVALSTRRLDRIEVLDPIGGFAVVGAGVSIHRLQEAAAAEGLHPGLDLPSRGSATIGGTISTNAGGLEAFRLGVMRQRILGLEAVLPDGSVFRDLTRVTKVSAGFDLKQLFIGAEGTLGIVTRAVVRLDRLIPRGPVLLLGLRDGDALLRALAAARGTGRLLAAEAMWHRYLSVTGEAQGWSSPDFTGTCPVSLLICLEDFDGADDLAVALFADLHENGDVKEGLLAQSQTQAQAIWRLRESSEAIYRNYPDAPSFDVSVPVSAVPAYVEQVTRELGDMGIDPFVFGHLGDGNLHISLDRAAAAVSPAELQQVERILYDPLPPLGGSFSAEHGIGLYRATVLPRYADPVKLALMHDIKRVLDPRGLMNPRKVLIREVGQPGR